MVRLILIILFAIIAAYAGLLIVGAMRWSGKTTDLVQRIHSAAIPPRVPRFDPAELDGLPAPVQRYFRFALTPGQPIITRMRMRQDGVFNMNLAADQWVRFTADQQVVTARAGFVWDARMAMAPGVAVHVIDAYVAGDGVLNPAVFGLFDIMSMRGDGEIARGELMRFFAEAALYPTALLPSQGVVWTAVDGASADATLTDQTISLTMRFVFAPDGAIESGRAAARGYTKGEQIEMHPWEGRWSNYQVRDGMRVPTTGEVAWLMPDGRKPYWRGTITDIAYSFAEPTP